MKNKHFKITACILILMGVFIGVTYKAQLYNVARAIDKNYLSESMKDFKARIETDEVWRVPSDPYNYNYLWLDEATKPIKIAHGLGGRHNANTLDVFYQSRQAGFQFYEVDIWLDENNKLRCHHGPTPPPQELSCTLGQLMNVLKEGEYLVLDLKTDFQITWDAIFSQTQPQELSKIIFQLYQPEHVALFDSYNKKYNLPGPIVSVYSAQRSLNHIFSYVDQAGLRAFAFPFLRKAALRLRRSNIALFTYPIVTCAEQEAALAEGVQAIYVRNDLNCGVE